jgi:hypothetical protein
MILYIHFLGELQKKRPEQGGAIGRKYCTKFRLTNRNTNVQIARGNKFCEKEETSSAKKRKQD